MILTIPTYNRCTIPPCICRILGKTWDEKFERTRPWTNGELMAKTGWSSRHLMSVYQNATWHNVRSGDIDLFVWACGLKSSTQRRSVWTIERVRRAGDFRRLRHLRPAKDWVEALIVELLKMVERVGNESRNANRT